jgi:ribosomal protein S27E
MFKQTSGHDSALPKSKYVTVQCLKCGQPISILRDFPNTPIDCDMCKIIEREAQQKAKDQERPN